MIIDDGAHRALTLEAEAACLAQYSIVPAEIMVFRGGDDDGLFCHGVLTYRI